MNLSRIAWLITVVDPTHCKMQSFAKLLHYIPTTFELTIQIYKCFCFRIFSLGEDFVKVSASQRVQVGECKKKILEKDLTNQIVY